MKKELYAEVSIMGNQGKSKAERDEEFGKSLKEILKSYKEKNLRVDIYQEQNGTTIGFYFDSENNPDKNSNVAFLFNKILKSLGKKYLIVGLKYR